MDFKERRFSIDPGKGKKMDGCPYSNFEDGHDVEEFIIPPKGYVFSGFRFDPDASNQIYDGKLYATYTKEPFKMRLKSNLWKLVLALIIVVIVGIVILLVTSIFKEPKTDRPAKREAKPKTEIKKKERKKKDEATTTQATLTETTKPAEVAPTQPEVKENVVEQPETPAVSVGQNTETQPQQPAADDPNVVFKQAFWELVHQKNTSMDAFTDLYNEYKTKVSGDEFDYLRFIILKDYVTFKAWLEKIKRIPDNQLQSINTIDALKNKVN